MSEAARQTHWQNVAKSFARHLLGPDQLPPGCLGERELGKRPGDHWDRKARGTWPLQAIGDFKLNLVEFREWTLGWELQYLLDDFSYLATSHADQETSHPLPPERRKQAEGVHPFTRPPYVNHTQRVWDKHGNPTVEYCYYFRW
jgi:hypothetical protein